MKYQTLNSSRSTSYERSKMFSKFLSNDSCETSQKLKQMENSRLALEIELEITQKALKYQTKRCQDLVQIYMKKLQSKDHEIETERQLRNRQMSYLFRTLVLFEMQIRHDQSLTKSQLQKKDALIENLRKQLSTCPNIADCSTSSCSETSASSDFIYLSNSNENVHTQDTKDDILPKNSDNNDSKTQENPFEIFLSTMGLSSKSLISLSPQRHFLKANDSKSLNPFDNDTLSIIHKTGSNSFKFWSESYL